MPAPSTESRPETESESESSPAPADIVLGLIADPDMPETVARRLAETLPDELDGDWHIEVDADPVTATLRGADEILEQTVAVCDTRGWTYAICITDLPVRSPAGPVVADIDRDRGVAVVSVPAMGGFQTRRRVHRVVLQVLEELRTTRDEPELEPGSEPDTPRGRREPANCMSSKLAPIRREVSTFDTGERDVRYVTRGRRGMLRLTAGMVRTNRPWRLVFGLSRALAAAVATSAFGLSSSTIWMVGDQLGLGFKLLTTTTAVATLVFWLIAAHDLWERRSNTRVDPQLARLYNASTLATLILGVLVLQSILFTVNFALAGLIVPASLLTSMLGAEATVGTYLNVAWAFTTLGGIAGALGSSLESDAAVRQAAYGYRESQRRSAHQNDSDPQDDGGPQDDGADPDSADHSERAEQRDSSHGDSADQDARAEPVRE
ncbi:hypothetical protein BJF85_23320 [Saccharomonospora sp. CUA-673]|uniref:hypothetical protein n=1 Tax=Saccharomonospora sp. CUA-673 TaxID=1904969 RepID=UPI0009679553|nr:hypothetical protein [Saccharomonospora sp. CUA-673]OLT42154.1 hypothetical protein BJF85_23320 [Saccharomonospora sp. CUA-673]